MRNMLSLLTLCFMFVGPAMAQTTLTVAEDLAIQTDLTAVDTKAQQALDGTVVLANIQSSIDQRVTVLEDKVAALEAALAALEAGGGAVMVWPAHTMFSLNGLQFGAGNKCDIPTGDGSVACPHNITDWEGDDTDVRGGCDSGAYDGVTEIYTRDPTDTTGGPYTCTLRASDPRRPNVEHVSVLVITVIP